MNPRIARRLLATMTIVIFACAAILAIYTAVTFDGEFGKSPILPWPILSWIIGVALLGIICLGSYVKVEDHIRVINENDAIIDRTSGEILYVSRKEEYVWKKAMAGLFTIHLSDVSTSVRSSNYRVSVNAQLSDENILKNFLKEVWEKHGIRLQYSIGIQEAIQEIVRYELYEFNHSQSQALEIFFNPMNSEQQKRFADFVREHLTPRIASYGLTITGGSFELA